MAPNNYLFHGYAEPDYEKERLRMKLNLDTLLDELKSLDKSPEQQICKIYNVNTKAEMREITIDWYLMEGIIDYEEARQLKTRYNI